MVNNSSDELLTPCKDCSYWSRTCQWAVALWATETFLLSVLSSPQMRPQPTLIMHQLTHLRTVAPLIPCEQAGVTQDWIVIP